MLLAVANVLALLVLVPFAGGESKVTLVPRCTVSHLRLSRASGQGALSHVYWEEALRNVGSGTCRLRGYPRVRLLDRHDHPINVRVVHTHPYPVRTVVLHPGQRAFFTFDFVTSGPCLPHFFSAYGLVVSPPHDGGLLVAHTGRFDVCSPSVGGSPGVSPVRATLRIP